MARFTLPRDIYYGEGALEELSILRGKKRALIVTGGKSMKEHGFLERLDATLQQAGLETALFDHVEPDPSVETVMAGAKRMQEFQPDVIAAIGGGSAIDAAKAMWVFYEYPDLKFDDIKKPFSIPRLRKKAVFVAVPSTSGTATEVTAFSVVTDYSSKIKYPLADYEITPDIAVLDPELTYTMPQKLVAHTGMDAMTHAIEAYVAAGRSAFSDPLAIQAIVMIDEDIVSSYHGCKEARARMHSAQCLAGMAFTNALLGIIHSLAHKVGAQYDLPHGCCNAIILPYAIQYNAKVCRDRYARIARTLGLPGSTDRQLTNALVAHIRELNRRVEIPETFRDAGVSEELFRSTLEYVAENAVLDPCTGSNPRPCDKADAMKLLACAYYGTEAIF